MRSSIKRMSCAALAAVTLLLVGAGRVRADFIDIPTNGFEEDFWGPGSGGNQGYGQVFTVPSGNTLLNDYTLTVRYYDTSFPFVSQLYAWNGTTTTGPALFTSGILSTAPTETSYTFTPSVAVTAGQQYIAFVTNQPDGMRLGGSGRGLMAANNTAPYSGGQLAFSLDNPQGGHWITGFGVDAEFHADFSGAAAAPEPGSLTLLGIGAVGLMGYAGLRRRLAAKVVPAA